MIDTESNEFVSNTTDEPAAASAPVSAAVPAPAPVPAPASAPAAASPALEAPVPKPRGRRKAPLVEIAPEQATEGASAQDALEAPAPKPRGRRKAASADVAPQQAAENVSAQDTPEAPAPKPRGRRKAVSADVVTDPAQAALEAVPSMDAPAADAPAIAEPAGVEPVAALPDAEAKSTDKAERAEKKAPARVRRQRISEGEAGDDQRRGQRQEQHHEQRYSSQTQGRFNQGNHGGASNQGHHGKNKNNTRNQNQAQAQQRKQRRGYNNTNREPVAPQTTREDNEKLKVDELRERAAELSIDVTGLLKAELVEKVYEASIRAEGFIEVRGVLDILADGYGFLRTQGYLPSETDAYVGLSMIRRYGLRKGDLVLGQTRPVRENEKYAAVHKIISVNDMPPEDLGKRVRFADLTPVYPDERLWMEHGKNTITARVIDLTAPIGKGQRGLIVSPPKAGKTTVLKDIASAITANNPEVHLMCLLVDERPEEVTDMERSIKGEVISSTFDMPSENHIAVAELVIERAKRLVENGADVVILLDSLTRLARAYNLAQPASGRILSGGVDSTALYPPKRFLGAARNIEGGGSLTILASALVETGSKMDEVIFEEFKGTGNMELRLDRFLADRRIFPAIDPVSSGTRKEDLLLDPQEAPLIWAVRRILANMNSTERAMDMLIKSLKQTKTNEEFLLRTAKKAQLNKFDENSEL